MLQYSSVDSDDLEFVSGLCWVLRSSLDSGGYSTVPKGNFGNYFYVQGSLETAISQKTKYLTLLVVGLLQTQTLIGSVMTTVKFTAVASGKYVSFTGLQKCLLGVQDAVEVEEEGEREGEGREHMEEEGRKEHRQSVKRLVQACLERLRGLERAVTNDSVQGSDRVTNGNDH